MYMHIYIYISIHVYICMYIGRITDNKVVDPISGESFYSENPAAGARARGSSSILLHDVMYEKKKKSAANAKPPHVRAYICIHL